MIFYLSLVLQLMSVYDILVELGRDDGGRFEYIELCGPVKEE